MEADDVAERPAVDAVPRGRVRRVAQLAAGLTLLIALVTTAVVVLGDDRAADQGRGSAAGDASSGKLVQTYPVGERQQIDDFSAQLLNGTTFDTTQVRGRVSVFNVWGSWCGPCRTEAPDLARVARERDGEVRFYGINVRDNPDAARAFERSFKVPYPSIEPDDSATALLAFRGALASAAVPSTVVLDAEGRVAARVLGPVSYRTLDALVADVIGDSAAQGARGN